MTSSNVGSSNVRLLKLRGLAGMGEVRNCDCPGMRVSILGCLVCEVGGVGKNRWEEKGETEFTNLASRRTFLFLGRNLRAVNCGHLMIWVGRLAVGALFAGLFRRSDSPGPW